MPAQHPAYCIIFDLDGTLIDTAPGLADTMNVLLAAQGRQALSLETLRPYVSHGAKAIITYAMAATGKPASEELTKHLFSDFLTHYRLHMTRSSRMYPGLIPSLDKLKSQGYRLGICTNRFEASARELLEGLLLSDYFSSVTGQDTFGIGKPDPRPVLETLKDLGGEVENAVFVGDSELDVAAARASGLPVIVTSFGYGSVPADKLDADHVIGHFDELPHSVRSLLKNVPRGK